MTRLRSTAALATTAIVLMLSSCGSDDPASSATTVDATEEWADGLCAALSTWTTAITAAAEPIKGGDLSKDSLQTAANDLKTATETLASDLKDLDKPDTESGAEAKDLIDTLSGELKSGADTISDAVKGVSGLADVAEAATTVGATVSSMGDDVESTFNSLEKLDTKSEIQAAFENSSSCQQLTATTTG